MLKQTYILVVLLTLFLMPPIPEYSTEVDDCQIYKLADNNTINCANRNLTHIPIDEIKNLNAKVLNFNNNNLKFSPEDIDQLLTYPYKLKVVEILLSNNCIENIPFLCNTFRNLEKIDLRYNNIQRLKESDISCFENLKIVCLDNNLLEDTELENFKTKFSNINFTCPESTNSSGVEVKKCSIKTKSTSNDTVSTTPVEDNVTALNTKENAKTTKRPNLVSEAKLTTKSGSLSTTPANEIDKNSKTTTKSPNLKRDTKLTTKSGSLSTTPANNNSSKPTEKNFWILIGCIVVAVITRLVIISCFIISHFYPKIKKQFQKKPEETENQENSNSEYVPLQSISTQPSASS